MSLAWDQMSWILVNGLKVSSVPGVIMILQLILCHLEVLRLIGRLPMEEPASKRRISPKARV